MKDNDTTKVPGPAGPYSQSREAAGLVFFSGQIAIDPETGAVLDGDIAVQAERVCLNIENALKAAGLTFQHVVKTTCFLTNGKDYEQFNDIYAKYFSSRPTRSCVFVQGLPKNVIVEIEVVAEKNV